MDDVSKTVAGLLTLMHPPGSGNAVARSALRAAGHLQCEVEALLSMEPRKLLEALPPGDHRPLAQAIDACTAERREKTQRLVERCGRTGIGFITIDDPRYPVTVRECLAGRAPAVLSAFGELGLLERPQAAVVGAREVSAQGKQLARACGREAARAKFVLTSGGAQGVDDAAQKGAADAGGAVISVLPQGLLTYRGPAYLRDAIRERRALLVSACMPDAPWKTHAAVERNDYIAALARAVCVIEPKKTGGSVRTARSALAYGRHVFVRCASESETICKELVSAGARPLDEVCDWCRVAWESPPKLKVQQPSLPGLDT